MSFVVVMFTGDLDIEAEKVEVLDSADDVVVVKAWFRKPERRATYNQPPVPVPTLPTEVEDPGPSGEQVDVSELSNLRVLVDA